jgi:hypothetical protein
LAGVLGLGPRRSLLIVLRAPSAASTPAALVALASLGAAAKREPRPDLKLFIATLRTLWLFSSGRGGRGSSWFSGDIGETRPITRLSRRHFKMIFELGRD